MPHASAGGYAPPISLRDLVNTLGIDALGASIAGCADAVPLEAKRNERWRYGLDGCVIVSDRDRRTQRAATPGRNGGPQSCAGIRRRIIARARSRATIPTFVEHCIAARSSTHCGPLASCALDP